MLERIGAKPNAKKFAAEGTPSGVGEVLGVIVDLVQFRVFLTDKRRRKISFFLDAAASAHASAQTIPTADLHALAGCLNSASHVQAARHYSTEIWKALGAQRGGVCRISDSLHEDLQWWRGTMEQFDGTSLFPLGRKWLGQVHLPFPRVGWPPSAIWRTLSPV